MANEKSAGNRTIVIGAGIVGASIAYHLAKFNVDATVIDRAGIAAGATGKSFAWINAHHFKDEAYHRLRYQSLNEYHRLDRELEGAFGIDWCGALSFDALGGDFDRRVEGFRQLGYPVDVISHNRFKELEPSYGHPPGRALHLPMEAAVEPARACATLIDGARKMGVRTLFGSDIVALRHDHGQVVGIDTSSGPVDADRVVIAAGIGSEAILASVDKRLPMTNRSGILLHSRPIGRTLNHVIWGDRIHMKQQGDGRVVIGEVFSETWRDKNAGVIIDQMLADAKRHLPDVDLEIDHTTIGMRPMPEDGMPVVGPIDGIEGLYVAVMHSGITLAPIVGRLAAEELLNGIRFDLLKPYRLSRFADKNRKTVSA